eukprot:TRINITY_DN16970_c0_g1_i1.p1 TRINITY_DN16970_c0_g1~~TRINITY_DN16970_c0_g1_i1.p1  ORF type:complete len:398 (+),score=46.31 TRINITY_DN16970_c0_g1_i1:66-1196(+)
MPLIETGLGAILGWGLGQGLGNLINDFRLKRVALQRIELEFQQLQDPSMPGYFYAWRDSDDEFVVFGMFVILDQTSPYYPGCYEFEFKYHEHHPRYPPTLRFLTPIMHPNLLKGCPLEAAFPLLFDQWNHAFGIAAVIASLADLVTHPVEDEDEQTLKEYRENTQAFTQQAQFYNATRAWDPLGFFLATHALAKLYKPLKDAGISLDDLRRSTIEDLRAVVGAELEKDAATAIEAASQGNELAAEAAWSPHLHQMWCYRFEREFQARVRTLMLIRWRLSFGSSAPSSSSSSSSIMRSAKPPSPLGVLPLELLCMVVQYAAPHSLPRCLLVANCISPALNYTVRVESTKPGPGDELEATPPSPRNQLTGTYPLHCFV